MQVKIKAKEEKFFSLFMVLVFGISLLLAGCNQANMSSPRWSTEQANRWYAKQGWVVGCNFTPSTAINQIEMWQEQDFDPETIDTELALKEIRGNSLELKLEIAPSKAEQVGLKVCCSPNGQEQTLIYYDATDKKLKIDTRKSSLGEGRKSIEAGPFELGADEPFKLQVFVDKSVVEVFANERQAVMRRIYTIRKDSLGVELFSKGGPMTVKSLQSWDMAATNPW